MKTLKITFFFGILLGFIGFTSPIELKLVKTVIPKEPIGLRKIVVHKGNIFLITKGSGSIYRINKKGEILTKYGRKGEGPGEFKYLSDFTISDDKIIGAGGFRINIYDLEGSLIMATKKKNVIFKVISSDEDWFYLVNEKTLNKKKERFEAYFNLYNKDDNLILSLTDKTKQKAYHPRKGRKLKMPWFPSPFCNRVVLTGVGPGLAAIFLTRQRSFYVIEENRVIKKDLRCVFKVMRVSKKDRENFFQRIIPKPSELTKNSVVFPEKKELFLGVIKWGDGWALVNENSFTFVNKKGECQETVSFPKEMQELEPWESGRPENLAFIYDHDLYFIKNNEEILIFEIKK